jgi:hypothetical protein
MKNPKRTVRGLPPATFDGQVIDNLYCNDGCPSPHARAVARTRERDGAIEWHFHVPCNDEMAERALQDLNRIARKQGARF